MRKYLRIPSTCSLSFEEFAAIATYSGSGFLKINPYLRDLNSNRDFLMDSLIETLQSGLKKLPAYQGLVIRATKNDELRYIENTARDSIFSIPAFWSTSLPTFSGLYNLAQVRLMIRSKTCRQVGPLSLFSGEQEVLCLPGTKFRILWPSDPGSRFDELFVEEINESASESSP